MPLKEWDIKINRGILTGCNEAFVIDGVTKDRLIAEDPKSAEIIRPILRGRDIKRYSYDFKNQWLIATHNGYMAEGKQVPPIDIKEYPAVKTHLDKYWDQISNRGDKGVTPYNLRNCAYMDDFSKQKIVWAELARTGNAFDVDFGENMVLNTAYILVFGSDSDRKKPEPNLKAIVCYLNSRAALFYLDHITSRFDKNGYRWLKQFVELIPLPTFSPENQARLASLYGAINETPRSGSDWSRLESEINEVVESILRLTEEERLFLSANYKTSQD